MSQFQIKHNHILYTLTGSLLLFSAGFLVLNLLHPLAVDNSYAESKDVDTNVNLEETLPLPSVSPSSVALTLEPNAAGDFDSAAVTVGVSTNHVSGYTLTMNTVGTSTDLSHDSSSDYKIEALSAKTSATDFANLSSTASINKWGFATDNNGSDTGQTDAGYYYPVTNSENPTTIKVTDGPANVSDTQVTFATKGKDLAAGTYSNTVIFSAVANALPETRTLDDFEYMQDVDTDGTSADICENSTIWTASNNKEYTLKDKRDNISYKVRKLEDGKCWMAQNFRMTKDTLTANSHSATLDSSDTNLSGTATYTMPNNASWQNTSATAEGAADATLLPKGSKTGPKASGTEALAHGAYYSWTTAVADASSTGTSVKKTTSICPKGWKLPDSDGSTSTSTNQFQALYNAYGSVTSFHQAFNTYYSNGATYYHAGVWWSDSSQYVHGVGAYGGWWSSTSHSSLANGAWGLYADTSNISPTYISTRDYGRSMRCVL